MPYGYCEECGEQDNLSRDRRTGMYLCNACLDAIEEGDDPEEDDDE